MATREQQVAEILRGDASLLALLPGGIYTAQEVGVEGMRREPGSVTAAAFDSTGKLKTCAVVRQRGDVPYSDVRSLKDKFVAVGTVVEIYFYEWRGYEEIQPAKARTYELLEGVRLEDSYPIWWMMETPYFYDVGPVANSTTLRQDWQVVTLKGPA